MNAEYYKNSIAVFGDTKPWAGNLRQLGGKFNSNLAGRPGWVYSKSKEAEVMQFLASANAGLVQPIPSNYTPTSPTVSQPLAPQLAMVPIGAVPEAMTPQAAMLRLQNAQAALPVTPKPITTLLVRPSQVVYPSHFMAADNLQYQIIMYTVVLPVQGQKVTVSINGVSTDYVVDMIKGSLPVDSFSLKPVNPPADGILKCLVVNGEWKVSGMEGDSQIKFHTLGE